MERLSPYYYLDEAKKEARKSNCDQTHWGAVLVSWQGKIIGRGHNHVAHPDLFRYCKPCIRKDIRSCTEMERCSAIHAEVDAILDVISQGKKIYTDTDMFIYGYSNIKGTPNSPIIMRIYPCMECARFLMKYKVQRLWFFRPTAMTEKERSWLPFPRREQDYDKPYLPDFIETRQFWFHPGLWLGLEGHEIQNESEGVFKLGQEPKKAKSRLP